MSNPSTVEVIKRVSLLTAHIDETKIVERVEIKQIKFLPNQKSGLHLHPCPVVGIVVKGSIVFKVEGQPVSVLKSGDAFFEPANTNVPQFDAQEEGATFVACYLLGPGENCLIKMLDS
jgi:quercetin dioxygenase-like cupin family protein